MESILIDFNNIIRNNKLLLLEKHISPIPSETIREVGLILIIPIKMYDILEKLQKGESRIQYLNTPGFISSILHYTFFIYDKDRKICELENIRQPEYLKQTLESLVKGLPNNVLLWSPSSLDSQNLTENIVTYTDLGFRDPYIANKSPLGYDLKNNAMYLCMLRPNDIVDKGDINEVKHVLVQYISGKCSVSVKFSRKAVEYLKNLSSIGSTINNDGKITQKEISGNFNINKIDENLVFYLDVDRKSMIVGEEERTEIVASLYNFHSHPKEAYDRYKTAIGWPSSQDFVGFLSSAIIYGTIFHSVIAIEGIYVISLGEYWSKNPKSMDDSMSNFIIKNYDFCYEDKTPDWYIETVNSIKYKNFPLFVTQYFRWDNASDVFTILYTNDHVNCFSTQSVFDKYKYLYKK